MRWARPLPGVHHITGARLTSAMLGYFLAVTAVVTLVPFRFEVPAEFSFTTYGTRFDLVANVLLFIPSGFLYRLWRTSAGDRAAIRVLLLGLTASLAIESAQLFEPDRFTSPIDVAANALGAWAGALLCDGVTSRIGADSMLVGKLSLEIPLMGLAYMLLPLLWVGSLAAGDHPLALMLLLFPSLFGATLLVFVHRYRLGRPGAASRSVVAFAAGLATFVGLSPAATRHLTAAILIAAAVTVFTVGASLIPAADPRHDRRFERRALRTALPFYAIYLLALLSITARSEVAGSMPNPNAILRMLELIAAFTVLGYLLAEWRGRLNQNAVATTAGVLLRTLPIAATLLAIQLLTGVPAAGWPLFSGILLAAAFGGGLYHLQRAHVRALIAVALQSRQANEPRRSAA